MEDELKEIIGILKKVFPKLLSNPRVMQGCDISNEELNEVLKTRTLSLRVLAYVAGDTFFETYFDELGITKEEARETSKFLKKTAKYFIEDLQEVFPYLKE